MYNLVMARIFYTGCIMSYDKDWAPPKWIHVNVSFLLPLQVAQRFQRIRKYLLPQSRNWDYFSSGSRDAWCNSSPNVTAWWSHDSDATERLLPCANLCRLSQYYCHFRMFEESTVALWCGVLSNHGIDIAGFFSLSMCVVVVGIDGERTVGMHLI